MQQIVALLKSEQFDLLSCMQKAQVLSALSSLIAASRHFLQFGREHHMNIVSACQSALRTAFRIFADASSSPSLVFTALSTLVSILLTAPRELRATLSDLEGVLLDKLFIYPARNVRTVSASLYARLIICVAEKDCEKAYLSRISAACTDLDDILKMMEAFSSVDNTPAALSNSKSLQFSPHELRFRFSSLSYVLCESLAVRLPGRMPYPLPAVVSVICRALQTRHVDPYAQGHPHSVVDPDGALIVNGTLVNDALVLLSNVLRSIEHDLLLPHASRIANAMRDFLATILLQCRDDSSKTTTVVLRRQAYKVVEEGIVSLGSVMVHRTVDLFTKFFEIEVALHQRCADDIGDGCVDRRNWALKGLVLGKGGRNRKRRRLDQRDGTQTAKESASVLTEGLKDQFDGATKRSIKESFEACVSIVKVMFESRGFYPTAVCDRLSEIEALLQRCFKAGLVDAGLVGAIASASVSGGSNRCQAGISPLFDLCAPAVAQLVTKGGVDMDCKRAALSGRSVCETLIHPRGPPMRHALKVTSASKPAGADHADSRFPSDRRTAHALQPGNKPVNGDDDLRTGVGAAVGKTVEHVHEAETKRKNDKSTNGNDGQVGMVDLSNDEASGLLLDRPSVVDAGKSRNENTHVIDHESKKIQEVSRSTGSDANESTQVGAGNGEHKINQNKIAMETNSDPSNSNESEVALLDVESHPTVRDTEMEIVDSDQKGIGLDTDDSETATDDIRGGSSKHHQNEPGVGSSSAVGEAPSEGAASPKEVVEEVVEEVEEIIDSICFDGPDEKDS